MKARKCDRCGKFYELYSGKDLFENKANAMSFVEKDEDDNRHIRKTIDLCPDCMKMLEKFISRHDYTT